MMLPHCLHVPVRERICQFVHLARHTHEREQEAAIESASVWSPRRATASACSYPLEANSPNLVPLKQRANGTTTAP